MRGSGGVRISPGGRGWCLGLSRARRYPEDRKLTGVLDERSFGVPASCTPRAGPARNLFSIEQVRFWLNRAGLPPNLFSNDQGQVSRPKRRRVEKEALRPLGAYIARNPVKTDRLAFRSTVRDSGLTRSILPGMKRRYHHRCGLRCQRHPPRPATAGGVEMRTSSRRRYWGLRQDPGPRGASIFRPRG